MRKIFKAATFLGCGAVCLLPMACGKGPAAPSTLSNPGFSASIIPPGGGSVWHYASSLLGPAVFGHTSLVFNSKIWVLGGDDPGAFGSQVHSSSDGIRWAISYPSFSPRQYHSSAILSSKMFVIGGFSGPGRTLLNDVWTSVDGATWTRLSTGPTLFSPRFAHTTVSFIGKLWLIAGHDTAFDTGTPPPSHFKNDVWSSMDGATWVRVMEHAPFTPRDGHSCVVFKGRFLVIGGRTASGRTNDVWGAKDGLTWIRYTPAAPFSPRFGHASVVYGDAVWVIGGTDATGDKNDAWYSYDGVAWTQATKAAPFSRRDSFTAVDFNTKMWILGGLTSGSSDVWYSP